MLVKEIMNTDIVHCTTATPVATVAALMKEHDIGLIPVLHRNTKFLAGVITDRDLCLNVLAAHAWPEHYLANQCMTMAVTFCKPHDAIATTLKKMEESQVRRLPVVENGVLVGLITLGDVIRHDAVAPAVIVSALRKIYAPADSRMAKKAA